MTDTAATEMIHGLVPLAVTLGITADTASPEEVVLSLDWAPSLTTGGGVLHGGIVKAHSRPLHVGRRVVVVETEIRGEGGKLAAKTIQSQAVL